MLEARKAVLNLALASNKLRMPFPDKSIELASVDGDMVGSTHGTG